MATRVIKVWNKIHTLRLRYLLSLPLATWDYLNCVSTNGHAYGTRGQCWGVSYIGFHLTFETGSLAEPEAHQVSQTDRLASLSLPLQHWGRRHVLPLLVAVLCGCWGLKLRSPCVCNENCIGQVNTAAP